MWGQHPDFRSRTHLNLARTDYTGLSAPFELTCETPAPEDVPYTVSETKACTGRLVVCKLVTGEDSEPDKVFHFIVTLIDPTINGTYGSMTFVNGVAEFTLEGGDNLRAKGLPYGVS